MTSKEELITYINAKQRETKTLTRNKLKNTKKHRLKYYKIKKHMDKFLSEEEYYHRFIVMPGLRGVGKTTILYQLYNYLKNEKNINTNNIFYLDVHDLKSSFNTDVKTIFNLFIEEKHQKTLVTLDEKIFLLVDEAQLDENWAKYAKLIFDKTSNVFMIFTGSSALDLELNTDAARRITREQIFPCNFQEYLLLKHKINLPKSNIKYLILRRDEESINKAIEYEKQIKDNLLDLENDINLEFKKFLHYQSFPFTLNINEINSYQLINEVIEKIVSDDLKDFYSFNQVTNNTILRLITYLATKKSGDTSHTKIAQSLELSTKTVKKILEILEKSQLIFSINAYGSSGKMLKKPQQHLFLSPSIKTAINYRVGRYDINHEKCFSVLAENLIASKIFGLTNESMESLALFYDADKKGVDFLIKHLDMVIPLEVGIGKKTKSQLTISKNKYNSNYGILVSNRTSEIRFHNNILYIPLLTFALM